jgi:hypothetical protein
MGIRQNIYFGRHFARLKYFTYHLVPVLAPNCKQHILSPAKVRNVCCSLAEPYVRCLFEFIRVDWGVPFMKHFNGGASYKSF